LKTYDYVPITPESLDRTKELRKEEANMSQTEKKQLDPQWEDKVHDYITPGHFDMLNTIEDKIQSCNDVLEEAGIGGISYRPQKSEIETYMENVAILNRFINDLE